MPPHPTSWRSILILSSHLSLGLPSRLFPSGLHTKTLYAPLLCPHGACDILLDFITRMIFGESYQWSSSLGSPLHFRVTSFLLFPNIFLSTIRVFSKILSLYSSLNVRDQLSHPHETTGKIVVLLILIFIFLDSKLEDRRSCTEW
jgi:hypothetical protein